MKLAIIVPGLSDEGAIKELLKKMRVHGVRVDNAHGDARVFSKMKGLARNLERLGFDKVIGLRDCECSDPSEYRKKANREIKAVRQQGIKKVDVRFCIMVHALEAWLLADESAIKEVIRKELKRSFSNPEAPCEPKKIMKGLFSKAGFYYQTGTKYAPEIAKHSDIKVIAKQCPSFREFQKLVRDP
jgi:hypothetical protein